MRSSDFVITRLITDRIGLHSVLLPLLVNVKENVLSFSERELKKALHDTLKRAAWYGLVCFEHAHVSYPALSFRPPGFSHYMGQEERRVQGLA